MSNESKNYVDLPAEPYPGWLDEAVDTAEASRITGVPIETLTTMRSRGGGPAFIRPKNTRIIRYFRRHLYEWMLSGGIKWNTADDGAKNADPNLLPNR
ncbi:MAG: hypothetical protein HQL45_13555 [Alphaproteobacteria bacterium]|nr:hypothetical protein [Alphaproteobacteria bacterium]